MTRAHPGTKVCRKCGQSKPTDEFPEHEHTDDGFAHICLECWGNRGYVDEDAKASTPPMSSRRLRRSYGLSAEAVRVAEEAADVVRAFREDGTGGAWEDDSPEDVVNRQLADASEKTRRGALAVALRLADEEMGLAREDAA